MKKFILLSFAISFLSGAIAANLTDRADVQAFIKDNASKTGYSGEQLQQILSKVDTTPSTIRIMNRPYEAKPWYIYRQRLVTDKRIEQGVVFWHEHAATINKASQEFKVNPGIIVATIGIESNYGKNKGSYKVINAISTLAFDYPRRATFFQSELVSLLKMTHQLGIDPFTVMGSYAGAIGQPQFMPSSFLQYAVDYSGDNKIDLNDNEDDVIASIANYYHKNGWHFHRPTAVKAVIIGEHYKKVKVNMRRPIHDLQWYKRYGIFGQLQYPSAFKANLISLEGKDAPEYWLAFHNFYVIRRYNPSNHYAMAIHLLAQAISKHAEVKKS